jgi:hypothetical protein
MHAVSYTELAEHVTAWNQDAVYQIFLADHASRDLAVLPNVDLKGYIHAAILLCNRLDTAHHRSLRERFAFKCLEKGQASVYIIPVRHRWWSRADGSQAFENDRIQDLYIDETSSFPVLFKRIRVRYNDLLDLATRYEAHLPLKLFIGCACSSDMSSEAISAVSYIEYKPIPSI